ncbi:MAG: class I SAM-dependent methyltransferase [Syntrophales bacterium]|nr:class I SAM-dependent methyltransferase [Syntrophales bacterium]MDD5233218.1 class I SAM-dependent methyltransferase [Syntrophales bacterium]MDD5531897.1 class I SAM-dependent methyltransferase [Syntrophales bacterium]
MKPPPLSSSCFDRNYDTKERFCSYWHQIDEIISLKPKKMLEIGIGNGFVSKYLRDKKINLITLDMAHDLRPDTVGSVSAIPFRSESFDLVSCCEVLEHLPFEKFPETLKEIRRIAQGSVILSLPDVTTVYRIHIDLPKIKPIRRLVPHPFHRPVRHEFDGEHYWEIGKKGCPRGRIEFEISRSGLIIVKTYKVFEFPYHRFFVLRKTEANSASR